MNCKICKAKCDKNYVVRTPVKRKAITICAKCNWLWWNKEWMKLIERLKE